MDACYFAPHDFCTSILVSALFVSLSILDMALFRANCIAYIGAAYFGVATWIQYAAHNSCWSSFAIRGGGILRNASKLRGSYRNLTAEIILLQNFTWWGRVRISCLHSEIKLWANLEQQCQWIQHLLLILLTEEAVADRLHFVLYAFQKLFACGVMEVARIIGTTWYCLHWRKDADVRHSAHYFLGWLG